MRAEARQEGGYHRFPMDAARAVLPAEAAGRWARRALERRAPSPQRRVVDSAHGNCLFGTALPISSLSDLPWTSPIAARQRPTRAAAARAGRRLTRPRQDGFAGSFRRWELQRGQKGRSAARYDRRGKGCCIIAIADRHGRPLAVHVAGAGAHEVGLVEATFQQCFLSTPPQRLIGEKAYESAPSARRLHSHYRLQLIAPHRDKRCGGPMVGEVGPLTTCGFLKGRHFGDCQVSRGRPGTRPQPRSTRRRLSRAVCAIQRSNCIALIPDISASYLTNGQSTPVQAGPIPWMSLRDFDPRKGTREGCIY